MQLVHLAVTVGPSRLPQMSGLPDDVEVEDDVELDVAPPVPLDVPPHRLVLGTQSWSCSPLAPDSAMQLRSAAQACFIEQSGAQ